LDKLLVPAAITRSQGPLEAQLPRSSAPLKPSTDLTSLPSLEHPKRLPSSHTDQDAYCIFVGDSDRLALPVEDGLLHGSRTPIHSTTSAAPCESWAPSSSWIANRLIRTVSHSSKPAFAATSAPCGVAEIPWSYVN
jgi:hypothetical protein